MTTFLDSDHGLVAVVRRHPIASFLVWTSTVGQAIAFLPLVARAVQDVRLPTAPFVVVANLVGLLLPALVVTRVVDGPAGLRRLWRSTLRVRTAPRWYALALVVVPVATTGLAVLLLGPPGAGAAALATALTSGLLVQLVLGFVTTNWWEEVAWTGFVQARLQDRHGASVAALVTGPLFALQHAPLAFGNGLLGGLMILLFITAVAVPFRFLQGWVANRTGSLFVVGLVHAAGNASTDGSGFFGDGLLPRLYPAATVGPMHLLASAAVGLVVVAATRGRLGRRPSGSRSATPAPVGPLEPPALPVSKSRTRRV